MAIEHSDTVLCLATCPGVTSIMASGGKDREVRVWRLECLVVGSGHTEALRELSSVMGCRAQPDRKRYGSP